MAAILPVKLPHTSYNVVIQPNQLAQIGDYIKPLKIGKSLLIVSNPEIFEFYGEIVTKSLTDAGFIAYHHIIPAGETYKTLDTIAKIYDTALENRLERSSTLISLGGGVIGDMTGFAAATWLRGVNFIQIPTSLLAMVDASIGGKTGVNHPQGKNLIGAFYQPKLVFIDPIVLKTLPEREFRAGMAEVIKYGIIWDKILFEELESAQALHQLSSLDEKALSYIITRSCQAKIEVVSQDEKEAGLRAILNYGHTIGHAIESLTGYSQINHGEAVGIGMVAAGKMATLLDLWTPDAEKLQFTLIEKAGLPTVIPHQLDNDQIIHLLQTDKKVKAGKVRFILPKSIGKVFISDQVAEETVRKAINLVKDCP
ncbi:MAG: 3-dehydroquinate synthase [Microcystaceae cyanobacterium]